MRRAYRWQSQDGADQPLLAGCIDVDIAATPFTNTLPVRRLGNSLRVGTTVPVVYIPVPALAPGRLEQAYTRLADGRCLYEGPIDSFQAELELDPTAWCCAIPNCSPG